MNGQAPVPDLRKKRRLFEGRSPEGKRAMAALVKKEIVSRRKDNPAKYFVPNGAIESLINAVKGGKSWIYIMPAANSVGKTAAAINILINIIFGPQNTFYKRRFAEGINKPTWFEKWPFPKKFWYLSEYTTLEKFVTGTELDQDTEIKKWFPRTWNGEKAYKLHKDKQTYFSSMTICNGWRGSFMSYDMESTKFESDKVGVIIFDEPPPKKIWNACLARLMLGGIVIMPMTPLGHSAWIKDELVDRCEAGDDSIYVMYADIEENCKEHGTRGRLSHEQIQHIVSFYTEEETEARTKGVFAHMSGRVYKTLHPDTNRHKIPPDNFNQDDYLIFNVVDPHDAKPPAIGWFAVDREEMCYAIDEYPDYKMYHDIRDFRGTTEDICLQIMRKEQENGWDPHRIVRVMDPNFGNKHDQAVGLTIKGVYRRVGEKYNYPLLYSTRVNDELVAGHQQVRNIITPKDERFDTQFKVGENCKNIWYQMNHYAFKEYQGKRAEEDGQSELVKQRYKDFPDVVRYFVMYKRKAPPIEQRQPVPWWYAFLDQYKAETPLDKDWRNPYPIG